ncbi:uncharacterized protein LOC134842301 [Symsagittifera roscoffensis]|uniref:uncharacterized protein LOC134842301 n=1 Tax=Symsagittifera roscoffensis TaxID=84072 RepID=UPI00307B590E
MGASANDSQYPSLLDESDEFNNSQVTTSREAREQRMTQRARDVLMDDLYTMFVQRERCGADFKFKCGTKIFKCHRSFLMARMRIYYSGLGDKIGIVTLPKHFQPDAFEAVLMYIYTAKLPVGFTQMALGILPISNYFSCDDLINRCELELVNNLQPENAVTTLDVARKESREHLQYKAAKFIKKNIDSVRRTESYRAFLDADEGNCRLLLDIVTQTLKRPTSVCSNPGSPSPPPYDPSAPASRFSLSDNAECFIPI